MDAREKLEALEVVFTALAHASRRQILLTVHIRGGMSAGEIAGRFEYAWPTISRHLRLLEEAGLLTHEKRGLTRFYTVDYERLALAHHWFDWFEQGSDAKARPRSTGTKQRR
ncbi:MAG TPA: metalloregulator ArsR/SmtB family transcription factor [Polyangiaceae bacterium]